jgi:hypothetical protein
MRYEVECSSCSRPTGEFVEESIQRYRRGACCTNLPEMWDLDQETRLYTVSRGVQASTRSGHHIDEGPDPDDDDAVEDARPRCRCGSMRWNIERVEYQRCIYDSSDNEPDDDRIMTDGLEYDDSDPPSISCYECSRAYSGERE